MCSAAPPTTRARAESCTPFMLLQPAIELTKKSSMPMKISRIPMFLKPFFIFIEKFGAKVRKKFGLFKNF